MSKGIGQSRRHAAAAIAAVAAGATVWQSCGGSGGTEPELPAIVIDSMRPDTATAGRSGTGMFIYGQNFLSGAQVLVNGAPHSATLNSSTQLLTNLSLVDLLTPDTLAISVSAPGAITSGTLPFKVLPPPPPPVLLAISTDSVAAGTSLTLVATGQHIRTGTRILWDGVALPSVAFLDTTRVEGFLNRIVNVPGVHQVLLRTAPPGGGTSTALPVTSYAGRPSITVVAPDSATAGRVNLTVTVSGTEFYPSSVILFDGVAQPTTYSSSLGTLRATVSPAAIATPGNAAVTVFTPAPGGGTSEPVGFEVKTPPPVPTLTSLSVDSMVAGEGVTVYATGAGFVPGTALHFDQTAHPTLYIADTLLASFFGPVAGGTVQVTAVTQPPGGGTSNALPIVVTPVIVNPAPAITDFAPRFSVSTPDAAPLTILGTGFAPGAIVKWDGSPRSATVVSDTRIDVTLAAGDLAVVKGIQVAVINPPPGGGGTEQTHRIIDSRTTDMAILDLFSNDLVWDSTRQVIYASLGLRVVRLDPLTGAITGSVSMPAVEVGAIRPSADWSRLYGVTTPVQILTLSPFSFFGSWDIGVVDRTELHLDASPKDPYTFAVLQNSPVGLSWGVVATYTLGVRSTTESGPMRGPVAYDTSGTVILARSGVDSNLVLVFAPFGQPAGDFDQPDLHISAQERWMKSAGNRLYTNRGRVINLVSLTQLSSLGHAGRTVRSVALDVARNRIYTLELIEPTETELEYCALAKYDMGSLAYLDEQRLPVVCPPHDLTAGAAGFLRWGADGVAFRSVGLVLLRTSLVD